MPVTTQNGPRSANAGIHERRVDTDLDHRHLEVNGFQLHYVVAGDGPPAVLVHGEAGSVLDWQWSIPRLSSLLRVHALDLPGHGNSSKPDAPYSARLLTDTVAGFLDALQIDSAILVGHSLGGVLATRVARRLGGRVRGLCLVDSGGLGRYISPTCVIETLPGVGELGQVVTTTELGRWHHAWLRAALLYARWWRVQPEWVAEQHRLVSMSGFSNATLTINRSTTDLLGQRESIVEDLKHVCVPSLVVWGAEDVVVPFWHGCVAAATLPDARLRVLPSCGHMPHVECPQAFVDELRSFLEERELI
jgi:pimeloyl-ACP methyl ester carboxylesterase